MATIRRQQAQLTAGGHLDVRDIQNGGLRRTVRSMANSGSQLSGGMILQIPNLLAFSDILLIYSIGSRNSSTVGRNVGASINSYGRFLDGGSRLEEWPRRSTVFISKGGARRALYGIVGGAVLGGTPFGRFMGADLGTTGLCAGCPPIEGGATISGDRTRIVVQDENRVVGRL